MKVLNIASFPVIVNVYAAGKFGEDCLVMPGESEDPKGPLLLRRIDGEPVYMTLSANFTVADAGTPSALSRLLVVRRGTPCSLTWDGGNGREGLRVKHFLD